VCKKNHPSILFYFFSSMNKIIVTDYVVEYRNSIPYLISPNDCVLEVGCADGVTTSKIAKFAKCAIGIDYREHCIEKARSRHSNIQFEHMDGFDIPSILKLAKVFDKIYIDLSGNRSPGMVLQLVKQQVHRCF